MEVDGDQDVVEGGGLQAYVVGQEPCRMGENSFTS